MKNSKIVYRDIEDGPYKVTDVPTIEHEVFEGYGGFGLQANVLYPLSKMFKRMREEGINQLPYDGPNKKES